MTAKLTDQTQIEAIYEKPSNLNVRKKRKTKEEEREKESDLTEVTEEWEQKTQEKGAGVSL